MVSENVHQSIINISIEYLACLALLFCEYHHYMYIQLHSSVVVNNTIAMYLYNIFFFAVCRPICSL